MSRCSFNKSGGTPLILALAVLSSAAFGQSQTERPEFDAASIRVNQSTDRASTRYDAGRVELHKASAKHMILRAFPLPDYQVVWPDWFAAERGSLGYDVSVTFPHDTTPERLQQMFQRLLEERFGLKTHWETRDMRAFEVRASERGSKLKEAANPAQPTDFPKYTARTQNGIWHLSSQLGGAPSGLKVSELLEVINTMHILDRPLVDSAEIKGYYDIDLTAPVDAPETRPSVTELLGALDKQLGLKATLKNFSLRVLVIDHMERMPTGN